MLFLHIRSLSVALIFFSVYFYVAGFPTIFGIGALEFMMLAIFGIVVSMVIGEDDYSNPRSLVKVHAPRPPHPASITSSKC